MSASTGAVGAICLAHEVLFPFGMTKLPASLLTALVLLGACVTAEDDLSPDDGFDDSTEDGGGKADGSDVATVHRFADRALFPEGGAFDPTDGAFYVGSLRHGTITKVAANGTETVFYGGNGEAGRLTLGMQVDAARRQLWVCTTNNSLGRIWIFDLATGTRSADIDLTAVNPQAACNDVLLDTDGTALVSDRENPFIYKIDGTRRVSVWATDPLLKGRVVSLNSMAFSADHRFVLTAVYLAPVLIKVSVANPRDVQKVKLSGDLFMDGFNLLNGPDDLVLHDGQLIVAFGSSLKRITPADASWTRATVKSTRTIGGVTALVQNGDELYGINGQSVRFALKVPPAPFQIFAIDPAQLR